MRPRGYDRKRSRNTDVDDAAAQQVGTTVTTVFRRALPLFAATLLVACSGGDEPGTASTSGAPASAAVATDAPVDGSNGTSGIPAALQLSAPLVGGGEIELGEFAGRPVLLWFWAPW